MTSVLDELISVRDRLLISDSDNDIIVLIEKVIGMIQDRELLDKGYYNLVLQDAGIKISKSHAFYIAWTFKYKTKKLLFYNTVVLPETMWILTKVFKAFNTTPPEELHDLVSTSYEDAIYKAATIVRDAALKFKGRSCQAQVDIIEYKGKKYNRIVNLIPEEA